jgi:hypothetical protein
MFEDADLIHRYPRAGATRDGVMIDVPATTREAGFKYPVALTAAAWAKCVAVPPGIVCQDEAARGIPLRRRRCRVADLRGDLGVRLRCRAIADPQGEEAVAACVGVSQGLGPQESGDRSGRRRFQRRRRPT